MRLIIAGFLVAGLAAPADAQNAPAFFRNSLPEHAIRPNQRDGVGPSREAHNGRASTMV